MSYLVKGLVFLAVGVMMGAGSVGREGLDYGVFAVSGTASAFTGFMYLLDAFCCRYIHGRLIEPPPKQLEAQKADSVYEFPQSRGKWSYYGGTDGKPPPPPPPPPPPAPPLPATPSEWLQRAVTPEEFSVDTD